MGWRLTVFVRTHYILSVYHEAISHYTPRVLTGRVVYFKSADRPDSRREQWDRVVSGGLDVHEVPGDHSDMLQRENASSRAHQLKRCIADGQASIPGPDSQMTA